MSQVVAIPPGTPTRTTTDILTQLFATPRGPNAIGLLFQIGLSTWSSQFALGAITTHLDLRQVLLAHQTEFVDTLARILTYDQCLRLLDFVGSEQWLDDEDVATSRSPFNLSVPEASSVLGRALVSRLGLTRETREYLVPAAIVALTKSGAPASDERAHLQILVSVLLSPMHLKRTLPSTLYLQVRDLACGQCPFNMLETNVITCLLFDKTLHRTLQEPCCAVVIVPKYTGKFDRDFPRLDDIMEDTLQQRRGMKRLREPGPSDTGEIAQDHSSS